MEFEAWFWCLRCSLMVSGASMFACMWTFGVNRVLILGGRYYFFKDSISTCWKIYHKVLVSFIKETTVSEVGTLCMKGIGCFVLLKLNHWMSTESWEQSRKGLTHTNHTHTSGRSWVLALLQHLSDKRNICWTLHLRPGHPSWWLKRLFFPLPSIQMCSWCWEELFLVVLPVAPHH